MGNSGAIVPSVRGPLRKIFNAFNGLLKALVLLLIVMMTICSAKDSFAVAHPDKVTFFNRMGDFFATVGKSGNEKARVKKSRKAQRKSERQTKQRIKDQKNLHKKMKKQNDEIMKKIHVRRSPHGRGGIDAQN